MSVLVILILVSVTVASTFLGAFIWAVRSGQYDDTSTPALRPLWEERPVQPGNDRLSANQKQANHR